MFNVNKSANINVVYLPNLAVMTINRISNSVRTKVFANSSLFYVLLYRYYLVQWKSFSLADLVPRFQLLFLNIYSIPIL